MRYLLFSFIIIIIFLFCYKIRNELFVSNTDTSISQLGKVYSEENRNGILYVNIIGKDSYGSVNTRVSTYSKYSITQLSPHYILLNSSDIGICIITDKISSNWDAYGSKHIKINGYIILLYKQILRWRFGNAFPYRKYNSYMKKKKPKLIFRCS